MRSAARPVVWINHIWKHRLRPKRLDAGSACRRILIWGDSNSSLPNQRQCWPSTLEKQSRGRFQIFNESLSGRTVGCDSGELNSLRCFEKKIKRYHYINDLLIMLGTNDLKMSYGPPSGAQIADDLNAVTDIAFAHHPETHLAYLLPPPVGPGLDGDFYRADERMRQLCAQIQILADRRKISLLDLQSILQVPAHIDADGIHLNSNGRYAVSAAVMKFLENCSHDHAQKPEHRQ